jgi:hypothetical protein
MELSRLGILMRFFSKKGGQTLQEFKSEMDALSVEEKTELSDLALKEMQEQGKDVTLKL